MAVIRHNHVGGTALACNPFIAMVETTDLWDFDNPSAVHLPRERTLLSQSEVSSGGVIIPEI